MKIRILKTEKDYNEAMERVDELFDAKPGTPKGSELELLLLVIKDYEDKHHPIALPDPIDTLKLKMQENGLKAIDLTPMIGSKSYVSQILNRKKPLTAEIMRILYKELGIPADILLG